MKMKFYISSFYLTGDSGISAVFFPAKHAKYAKNTISHTIKLILVLANLCLSIQGYSAVVSNVFKSFDVPGQVSATMFNMIYEGSLSTPVYTFHVPYGSDVYSIRMKI